MINSHHMKTIPDALITKFRQALFAAYPDKASECKEFPLEITQSTSEKFGHYQFNSAMKLTKVLQANPRQIADALIAKIDKTPLIEKLEVAGPGFINITLNSIFISEGVDHILKDPHLGIETNQQEKKVIVEFSSPNTAKEMHVGHLRSTIIGDSLARLFEFLGYNVLRINHIGDWGTAFGMLIAYMKESAPHVLEGKEKTDLTHLVTWYKASKVRFDADSDFKKRSQNEVVALQGGDSKSLYAWEIICTISKKAYQEIYDMLDIKITEKGESFYNPFLKDIVEDLEAKGLIEISDGAKCIFIEGFQNREGKTLPLMIQKSDGGYNYDTTDMAAIRYRSQVEKANRIIYVVDAGQSSHFQMVFKAAEKAGYIDPKITQVDHVPFGLVLGGDGKKFRTRSGETERLIDLIQTAIQEAKKILQDRKLDLPQNELDHLAQVLGVNAIKYADLSCNRISDYTFSYERMLRFEGNTAAFLMYAYVRVAGIKRKIQADIEAIKKNNHIYLEHPSEIALGVHLMQFSETLEQMTRDLLPNRLADYLYNLAEKFNAFYRDCIVEGSPQQNSRLLLCETVALTMKQGMELLGLQTVDKM